MLKPQITTENEDFVKALDELTTKVSQVFDLQMPVAQEFGKQIIHQIVFQKDKKPIHRLIWLTE